MSIVLVCARGHRREGAGLPADAPCPVCGSPLEACGPDETTPYGPAGEATGPYVPAPPAPASAGPLAKTVPYPPPVRAVPSIPGYEVLEELGRGGMGVVYKADI